jgi:hypothetical protein
MNLARIRSIRPEVPSTWEGQGFLTFDLDWACDGVLTYSIDLIENAGVEATWFVTHDTPLLARLRANPRFELGIHPNFNDLMFGSEAASDAAGCPEDIVETLLRIVPEAVSVRSHSMAQSSRLLDVFRRAGLTHDCNHFIPASTGIALKPWRHWNGMIKVPYCWEDDVALQDGASGIEAALRSSGLVVFDFHPVHVALNSPSLSHYEVSRPFHADWSRLQHMSFDGDGVRKVLQRLLSAARETNR